MSPYETFFRLQRHGICVEADECYTVGGHPIVFGGSALTMTKSKVTEV